MTAAPDLAAWLRKVVTERLELARKATQVPWEPEGDDPTDDEVWIDVDGEPWRVVILRGPDSHANMLHVAANDPRDTIARCEAELAILVEHHPVEVRHVAWSGCATCKDPGGSGWPQVFPCRTVRLLGSGYRHRAGYDSSWAP